MDRKKAADRMGMGVGGYRGGLKTRSTRSTLGEMIKVWLVIMPTMRKLEETTGGIQPHQRVVLSPMDMVYLIWRVTSMNGARSGARKRALNSFRVSRGGAWATLADYLRVGVRFATVFLKST